MSRGVGLLGVVLALAAPACASHGTSATPATPPGHSDQPAASESEEHPAHGPSTADERAWAVKLSHDLEADPLSENLAPERAKLMEWLVDVPDLTVELCGELVGPGLNKEKPDAVGAILVSQQMFSQAAYNIEHSNAANSPAAHLAGLQGVLHAYAAIVAAKPDARNPYFDKLAELQTQGKLQGFVDQAVQTCNKH